MCICKSFCYVVRVSSMMMMIIIHAISFSPKIIFHFIIELPGLLDNNIFNKSTWHNMKSFRWIVAWSENSVDKVSGIPTEYMYLVLLYSVDSWSLNFGRALYSTRLWVVTLFVILIHFPDYFRFRTAFAWYSYTRVSACLVPVFAGLNSGTKFHNPGAGRDSGRAHNLLL